MNTFSLLVSTPDGDLFRGEAVALSVRGTEGELAILAGHTPFMTAVKPGDCKIILPNDEEKHAALEGGLLSVNADSVTLLSSSVTWK